MSTHAMSAGRPPRIAVVTSIHPDFDSRIWKHVRSVAASGWEVDLVAPWPACGVDLPPRVRLHPFRRVARRWQRPVLVPARLGSRLLPLLRRCDLVHFHDIDILPWMAAVAGFKPVVYDVHEDYPEEMLVRDWIPGPLRRPLAGTVAVAQRLFSKPVRNVVTVCPEIAAAFPAPRYRTIVMPNYASSSLCDGADRDVASRPPTVVFTGSQHANNGSLLLLEIAGRMARVRPEVRFLSVDRFASASARATVLSRMRDAGLSNVEIVSNVRPHEIMGLLNRGTIGLSPNLRVKQQITGSHNKIYEYMAAALPIVASDLPRQAEVLGETRCGLLARPEDPESFVRAIVTLVDDRERATAMGRAGQEAFLERYCWESQLPRLLGLYAEILEDARAAA